jgi:predicted pyridoxine 5'-phosphate oxidase superfamily flavin-nucleotide-binding protein
MAEVTIPQNVQDFLKGKLGWVSTASADGVPNAVPKGSVRLLDDSHIMFADLFSLKTRANLRANPHVGVTVIDLQTNQGYQLKGTAELLDSGPIFERMKEEVKKAPRPLPPPVYVVVITVTEIYDQSLGPNAGQRIA